LPGSVWLPHPTVPCTSAGHTSPRSSSATEALLTCSTDSGNPGLYVAPWFWSWTTELIQLAICRTLAPHQHMWWDDWTAEKPQGRKLWSRPAKEPL
jgi:hypothetical protein